MSIKYMYKGKKHKGEKPIAMEWLPDWFSKDETSNMLIIGAVVATAIVTVVVWTEINKNS